MAEESDNGASKDLAQAMSSRQSLVRSEGPESFLPGAGGLTPLVDPALSPPSGGFGTRLWSARRWWLAPAFTILGGMVAAWPLVAEPTPNTPAKYTTDALVRYASTHADTAIVTAAHPGQPPSELVEIVRTEVQLIAEPESCALAAHNAELRKALPWLAKQDLDDPVVQRAIARKLRPLFTATLVSNTALVRIESSSEDRPLAAAVCNAFAEAFIVRCMARIPKPREVDLEPIRAQIKALQAQKAKLVEQADTTEVERQQTLTSGQIQRVTTMKAQAIDRQTEGRARLERLGQASADGIVERFTRIKQVRLDEEKARDPLYQQEFKDQVSSAKDYAAERGSGKTEQHRDVVLAADRMHNAEKMVAKRLSDLSDAVDAAIAKEQAAAVADAKAEAAESVKVADQQIADCDKKLAEWDDKARSLGTERARREGLRAQISQIDVDLQRENNRYAELPDTLATGAPQQTYDLQVVRRAVGEPMKESAPTPPPPAGRKMTMAAIAVGGGLCTGLLLTFATGALRVPRRQAPPITQTLGNCTLLGAIPLADAKGRSTQAEQKAVQLRIADGFRQLRIGLLERIGPITPGEAHTLALTSAHRGDGRSCIAVGLAVSLAKAGRRVLLVDADLRNPDLHRTFGRATSPGLAELIEGKADPADAIVRTDTANVSLLPAGAPSVDPGELLSWQEIGNYLSTLGRQYDHVIIDSAPLLETADAHRLIGCVRCALLVIIPSANEADLQAALELLRSKNATLVGAVMNRA